MSDLISVIVPVYNVEDYLDRCINSIINQTYNNLEIILVDDGSTDSSGKMCDDYALKDDRIKVLHKENGGVSSARNAGLDIASGDYIGFVDSDDYIACDMYETLFENAIINDADISMCQIQKQYLNGNYSHPVEHENCMLDKYEIMSGFFEEGFIKDIMYSVYDKIYKQELLENIRFKEYYMGEDILFSFQTIIKAQKAYYDNKIGYYYILRENSAMTSNFSVKRFDYVDAVTEIENICKNTYSDDIVEKAHNWVFYHTLVNYRAMIIYGMRKEYCEVADKYKTYLKSNKACFGSLNRKRKIDYILSLYFPFVYKVMR